MIYRALRWISGIAVNWFYGELRITNRERIPEHGPLFIAVNHQNSLVDSLITGWVVPRRVTMTAKATLTENPFIALLFRILGVVPLRRTSDERTRSAQSIPDRSRNSKAFREILRVLERDGAILIFPEGKSHNQPGLEPLKSGLARLALSARDDRSIKGVRILPLGLVFEDKSAPGSDVRVHVGEAIGMDEWPNKDHAALTAEIVRRLRAVSEHADPAESTASSETATPSTRSLKALLVSLAAAWGRITHELPVRMARRIALRRSRDADEPAMLTMLLGTVLALATYVVVFAIVNALVHSIWISSLYVASLVLGAYCAAFENRRRV